MTDDLSAARGTIREGVRTWFSELCQAHAAERFYAFSFGCHDDFVGPSLWANSLEALAAKCEEPFMEEYAWNPGEWEYSTPFAEAWRDIPAYDPPADNYVNDAIRRYRATCVHVTIAALKELTDEGFWKRTAPGILVFLSIWDSGENRWITRESMRRINSPEDFAAHPLSPGNWLGDNLFRVDEQPMRRRKRNEQTDLARVFAELFGEWAP